MSSEFVRTSPEDLEAVVPLLLKSFQLPPHAQMVEPALMAWKFFQPRPDWEGGRSYFVRKDTHLIAHGCVFPATFLLASGPVRVNHLGDWAADKTYPGGGFRIWSHLSHLTPVMLTVGGSPATRAMLPKMGYRTAQTWDVYARVVRPWKQFRTDPFPRGWKQPLRVFRNKVWSLRSTAGHAGWSARGVQAFDDSITPLLESRAVLPWIRGARSPELLNYFLSCPAASFSAYLLVSEEKVRGWFLLSRVRHQVRIADIWVESTEPSDWRSAYSVAAEMGVTDPECCEIVAASSIDIARQAIAANGFRHRGAEPVFVYDPKNLLGDLPLQIEMVDGDAAFFIDPSYPYLT